MSMQTSERCFGNLRSAVVRPMIRVVQKPLFITKRYVMKWRRRVKLMCETRRAHRQITPHQAQAQRPDINHHNHQRAQLRSQK